VDAYGANPTGTFLNRVHSYEATPEGGGAAQLVHFPKSCLHCEDAPCVTVCPTGASYKRVEAGIVLVNEDHCIGCGLCAWSCPYGARELDALEGVMKKCTLCVDRIYNENLPEEDQIPSCVRTCPAGARHFGDFADPDSNVSRLSAERGGMDLMPEMGTKPVNKYLPPRPKDQMPDLAAMVMDPVADEANGLLGWLDRALGKLPGTNGEEK
jgi:Fe-S-cluster-containing dehydrogenase component